MLRLVYACVRGTRAELSFWISTLYIYFTRFSRLNSSNLPVLCCTLGLELVINQFFFSDETLLWWIHLFADLLEGFQQNTSLNRFVCDPGVIAQWTISGYVHRKVVQEDEESRTVCLCRIYMIEIFNIIYTSLASTLTHKSGEWWSHLVIYIFSLIALTFNSACEQYASTPHTYLSLRHLKAKVEMKVWLFFSYTSRFWNELYKISKDKPKRTFYLNHITVSNCKRKCIFITCSLFLLFFRFNISVCALYWTSFGASTIL